MNNPIVTAENYFSPETIRIYTGHTEFCNFQQCESSALAMSRGEWAEEPSTALLVGSYVDAYFSGTLPLFRAQHSEIFKRDGCLKSDYEHAEYIIRRIERDPVFMREAMNGQKQVVMTGEIEGVPVKIKVDCLTESRIVDWKIMKDMADVYNKENREWQPFWRAWDYEIEGAMYREIVRQNTGLLLPFGLAVATKEKPEPDIDLIELPDSALDEALEIVRSNIVYYDGLKQGLYEPVRCGKCDHCKATKVLTGWRELEAC